MTGPMLSRRSLLTALGLGGAAALVAPLRSGLVRVASAGTPVVPTRILFVYGMGSIRSLWAPTGPGGAGAPTETSWALGPLHGPLAGHESELLFLDGLDMTVADLPQSGTPNGHQHGGIAALTAAKRESSSLANGVSIDQLIAQQINSPAPVTKIPSLELSAGCNGGDVEGGPHYLRPAEIVSPERDPKATYKRLFADFVPPDNSAAKKAAADALAQKKSVLDFAAADFAALGPRLSTADRAKLDAHASTIRDLEARLSLAAVPAPSCAPPDATTQSDLAKFAGSADPLGGFDLDARLVTAAFSCDLTRVASIHLPTHYDLEPVIGYKAGMFGTSDSHDLTHHTNDEHASLWGDAGAMAMIKKVHTEQAKMFASLLTHLGSIREADGGTLLDHTAVLWCGQIAEGGHDVHQLPWILAGSAGGKFKPGRYLRYDRPGDAGPAHNDLFVALANAMGVPITTFGEPSVCKGALPRLAG
ncbi:MAG: DUF1552 domain-containing protein [Polyangiales bacterium]